MTEWNQEYIESERKRMNAIKTFGRSDAAYLSALTEIEHCHKLIKLGSNEEWLEATLCENEGLNSQNTSLRKLVGELVRVGDEIRDCGNYGSSFSSEDNNALLGEWDVVSSRAKECVK
jgi:hypothetical protein